MSFEKALSFVLSWEGGHSNDPDDAGGETYRGITRVHHPEWQGWVYVDQKEFLKADVLVSDFYYENYWIPSDCDELEIKIAMVVFDCSVNQGISFAKTIPMNDYRDAILARIDRYNTSAKKGNNIKFLRGWLNRTISLWNKIKKEEN